MAEGFAFKAHSPALRRERAKIFRTRQTGRSTAKLVSENGAVSISFDGLIKLATALGVPVADLFQSDMGGPATARRSVARLEDGSTYETPAYQYRFLCTDPARKRMIPIHTRLGARWPSSGD